MFKVNARVEKFVTRSRVVSYGGIGTLAVTAVVTPHPAGVPIGLLLALTYSGDQQDSVGGTSLEFYGVRPNVRIN